MLCRIAELNIDLPIAEGLALRYRDYACDDPPDGEIIKIKEELFQPEAWPGAPYNMMCYMESACQFYTQLMRRDGMLLHAASVEWQGKGYLFSAPSQTGKTTHRRMWQQLYGEDAVTAFNDDKPELRYLDGKWYAYGTPWSGKDGVNKNIKVPLAGICYLQQAPENRIRRLSPLEIITYLTGQTIFENLKQEDAEKMLTNMDRLIRNIPVFLLECTPTTDAAKLASETMAKAALDAGL